ncbi:MAG TPA: polyprenyl synthetase family protein [Oligoflexia bacterium]|nr:polyprenyl synthetase family protein [Oligoflexia bacterium]HMP47422.1 polyprenyl synthetase family protein [Oligoflexia bacterium]
MVKNDHFKRCYEVYRSDAESVIGSYLDDLRVFGTMREVFVYTLGGSGKLFRPVLMAALTDALSLDKKVIHPLQFAIELVHTSSLIHDDLPALDNDDFRRGKASCHKVYGEGVAMLAGDMMLSEAISVILLGGLPPEKTIVVCSMLSQAISNMCIGQVLDLESRQLAGNLKELPLSERLKELEEINLKKTGALFSFSIMSVAELASLSIEQKNKLSIFYKSLSLLFQLRDDLLDSKHDIKEGEYREMNYSDLLGSSETCEFSDSLVDKAVNALDFLGIRGVFLRELTESFRVKPSAVS